MSLSSYIWTTFSSIPTTFPNTKLMLRKYFVGSALMDCLHMQTNASSMSLPEIPQIHAVSQRPHHGPLQGPNHPRLAGTPESQRHPVFPWIRKLLSSFHFRILQNHCSTYASYPQGYPLALH